MTQPVFDAIQRFTTMFDLSVKERGRLYDNRDDEIQRCLSLWAESIPESMKRRYGRRILRIQETIQTRKFIFGHYNPRFQEVVVYYGRYEKPELILSITKDKILSKDIEYTYKEIIFPYKWSTEETTERDSLFYVEEVSQVSGYIERDYN